MPTKAQPIPLVADSNVNPFDHSIWLDQGNIYSDGQGNFFVVGKVNLDNGLLFSDGAGNITAVGETLSASLTAVNATLSGNVTAVGETLSGSLTAVNATLSGFLSTTVVQGGQSSTAVVIATSGTINTAGLRESRVAPAGAVTGVGLQAGTQPGQEVYVVNESAAASSVALTTNVATAFTLAGLTAAHFIWDSVTSLWYHCV